MNEAELKAKMEELGRAHEEFKRLHTAELAEAKKVGQASADRLAVVEKANEDIQRLNDEIKAMKTAMNRTPYGDKDPTNADEEKTLVKKAFDLYARKGVEFSENARKLSMKAMNIESDADGGFLVPIEMSSEIVKKVFESSPMREICSVQTISTSMFEILEDLDQIASGWVGEQSTRDVTATAKLNKVMIPVHELYAQPDATQNFLDDAAINVEAWLAQKVSDKFGRDEATSFVRGDGVSKPKGFLNYAAGDGFGKLEQIVSGSAATLTPDGIMDLINALKEPYHTGAMFLLQRSTEKVLRKFKDTQGRYLWEPGLNGDQQSSILGYGIRQAADMDAIGANALALAFGNFKQGYQIVDRVGIRVIRDVYSAKPRVLFYTTKRVGGGVKNFEAIKLQKCST